MRTALWLLIALNTVTFASLIVYYVVVFLNATFTFDPDFTVASVPFYDSVTGTFRDTFANRFFFESWVFASDLLRPIVPLSFAHAIPSIIIDNNGQWSIIPNLIWVVIVVLEVLKAIWRGYQWGFCADFQFCRNFDPAKCAQKFDCPANFLWLTTFWYNIFFLVLLILYLFVSAQLEPGVLKFYKYLETHSVPLDDLKPSEEQTRAIRFYNEIVRQVRTRFPIRKKSQ